MKVQINNATAAQLRWYITNTVGIPVHDTASRKNVMNKLHEMKHVVESFEVPDDLELGAEVETEEAAVEVEKVTTSESAEMLVKSLVEQGMAEDQAKALAGIAVSADAGGRETAALEDFKAPHFTINVQLTEEAGGSDACAGLG